MKLTGVPVWQQDIGIIACELLLLLTSVAIKKVVVYPVNTRATASNGIKN
jgi:hypothetical protein